MAKYQSTKRYGNDRGLSCCFRQWRSTHSHCSFLHGYAIGIKLVFESDTLDSRNWVFDFGGCKPFKDWLDYMFDHTLLVAEDDPKLDFFRAMNEIDGGYNNQGICDLRVVPDVGCEKFSQLAYEVMDDILKTFQRGESWRLEGTGREYTAAYPVNPDVRLVSAEVFEHEANSGIYRGDS